jgi:hypothetical protein
VFDLAVQLVDLGHPFSQDKFEPINVLLLARHLTAQRNEIDTQSSLSSNRCWSSSHVACRLEFLSPGYLIEFPFRFPSDRTHPHRQHRCGINVGVDLRADSTKRGYTDRDAM